MKGEYSVPRYEGALAIIAYDGLFMTIQNICTVLEFTCAVLRNFNVGLSNQRVHLPRATDSFRKEHRVEPGNFSKHSSSVLRTLEHAKTNQPSDRCRKAWYGWPHCHPTSRAENQYPSAMDGRSETAMGPVGML
jgi:hypothetical protein